MSHRIVPVYVKDDQLYKLQLKIDHLHFQGIVRKPEEMNIILKLVYPIMFRKKGRAEDNPCEKINPITEVLAENIINEWTNYPYEKVAGYVMKRNVSIVMFATDNLTYNTSTALIKSEKAGDIENALLKPYYHIKPR